MAMYHPGHPNRNYETAYRVEVFDPPHAISWKPGYDPGDGKLPFGGWIWRYDLAPLGPCETDVRLLTIGRRYPRSCAKQGQSSHLSRPITWTIRRPTSPIWSSPDAGPRREPCPDIATEAGSCSYAITRVRQSCS